MKIAFVALLTLSLTSCSLRSNDAAICSTPGPVEPPGNSDQATKTQTCIHRWAYRLAMSPEDAAVVADAVMGACQDAVDASLIADRVASTQRHSSDNDASVIYEGQKATKGDGSVVMEYKGDPKGWVNATDSDNALRRAKYKEIALFRVVQARAGKCKVP